MIDIDIDMDLTDGSASLKQMMPMILPDDDYSATYDEDIARLPKTLPVLPLRDATVFPNVAIPVIIGRDRSKNLLNYLETAPNKHILAVTQKNPTEEDPTSVKAVIAEGTIAEVLRVMQVNEDLLTIIIQGKRRAHLDSYTQREPFLRGRYTPIEDYSPGQGDIEYQQLAKSLLETMIRVLIMRGDAPKPFVESLKQLRNPETIINFASNNFPEKMEEKISLLLTSDLKQRGYIAHKLLSIICEQEEVRQQILQRTRHEMDKQQKEYFLQQQMRVIRKEIEDDEDEATDLLNRASEKKWKESDLDNFEKEVKKLQRMAPQSPDYSIQLQYLETLLELPWQEFTADNFDIGRAQSILDQDHFGLDKVKERILEHLSVLKLKGNLHAPILCLYGPPGVGKTSLGKSIANALGRNYVRISLGGLHDEAEIRGHRRTYIGAMPGRIIKGFLKAGSSNPVFVLDEIDKLGNDYKGDPSSALLEVLDPEQNNTFHDNYLDIDYDLSQALFIATANSVGDIPPALRDRMEMIEVTGYIQEEKVEIGTKHLLPKALKQVGLNDGDIRISRPILADIIEDYTRESGVREFDKRISEVIRKVVKKAALANEECIETYFPVSLKKSDIKTYLGTPKYSREKYDGNKYAGVVTGLAWTSVGGEILMVESAPSPSKSGKMTITGNLGDVMKESAILALEYLKSHAQMYDIPTEIFDYWNVHIHVPEGAIPKDGPSAGITLVTSLVSTFTQRQVLPNIAMTGEITLRGKVLPVGGIREKILAAKRSGVTKIILCKENQKDINEIKPDYVKGLEFVYVTDISEVISHALSNDKVDHPIDLMERVRKAHEAEKVAHQRNQNK